MRRMFTPPGHFAKSVTALAAAAMLLVSAPVFAEDAPETAEPAPQNEVLDVSQTGLDLDPLPTEKTVYQAGEGTITFDPETKTLTLDNATLNKSDGNRSGRAILLENASDIDIVLVGSNSISGFESAIGTGSGTEETKLTLSGTGSLNVENCEWGFHSLRDVSFDGVSVTVNVSSCPILIVGVAEFKNQAVIDFEAGPGNETIQAESGVKITSGSEVKLTSDYVGIYRSVVGDGTSGTRGDFGVQISDSTLTITKKNGDSQSFGIVAENTPVQISNSKVNISGTDFGIYTTVDSSFTAVPVTSTDVALDNNAVVSISANSCGVYTPNGTVKVASGSDFRVTAPSGLVARGGVPAVSGESDVEIISTGSVVNQNLDTTNRTSPMEILVNTATTADGASAWDNETAQSSYQYLRIYTPVSADGWTGVYDGSAHGITVHAEEGATIAYSADGETYSSEPVTFIDAADEPYTVYFTITSPQGKVRSGSAQVKIDRLPLTDAKVTLDGVLQADGTEKTQGIGKVMVGDIEVPADAYTVTGATQTETGTYKLTLTANENSNFTGSCEVTYVVLPAELVDADGTLDVTVKMAEDAPAVSLKMTQGELLQMLVDGGDLSADELAQIAEGAHAEIVVEINPAAPEDAVKTAMANAVPGYKAGQYLDITLFKNITLNGETTTTQLHSTAKQLPFTVKLADALANKGDYRMVRYHADSAEVLQGSYSASDNTYAFGTDRFSIYMIAYKEKAANTATTTTVTASSNSSKSSSATESADTASAPATPAGSTAAPALPATGDTSNPALWLAVMVASALGLGVTAWRKQHH